MNITYSDLFQLLLFIVALVSLCYQIFKGKEYPPLLPIVTARACSGVVQLLLRVSRFRFPFSIYNIAYPA